VYNHAEVFLSTTDESLAQSTHPAKPRAFSASELVGCNGCSRTNPPNRSTCLYCGATLPITELSAFSTSLAAEDDANSATAFHVVACSSSTIEELRLNEIAELLNLKPSELQSLLTAGSAPIFSAPSEKQAQTAVAKLAAQGVTTQVVSDAQLAVDNPPQTITALEVHADDLLTAVRRGKQTVATRWSDVMLIVMGRLYFASREIDQKRDRHKQVVDEREILTDDAVLDIYPRGEAQGWRIRASNFDFSCLGEKKQLTAFANFTSLTAVMRQRATAAAFDDSYLRLRTALNSVWPEEPNAHAKARRRTGFVQLDSSVTSLDNEIQFTRYSRLLRYLQTANSEDHVAQT